ncbi:Coiled-coil domain-containing protein 142 [Habropoda laboriosa]|uniref:Coiled-coil domain-containing protein 142 n=1 Tax=Habropoda laboriosa TaxID=597456 RepID=A0A0L7RJ29_9HYME|nr:PREDICTED: coiled-coil domain-containing protein 142 [Habropoda laboriosa]KOC70967.1 Coiled-coil domain-containing protein 142 [Habropoda laboriosa]
MDTNYRANICKWLPPPSGILEKWFADSSTLVQRMGKLMERVALIIRDITDAQACDLEVCKGVANDLEEATEQYRSICTINLTTHPIYRYKIRHFLTLLKRKLNVLARFNRNLINEIVDCNSDQLLRIIFRLVNIYNDILDMNIDVSDNSVNVFQNDCPAMLEPMKKMSVTRILQMLAKNKAEESCHELIDCLLANYEPRDKIEPTSTISGDADVSENSSIEIYRALTRHLTPPLESFALKKEVEVSNIESIQALVNTQNEQVVRLLNIVQEVSPKLLGIDALKSVNGEKKLRSSAIKKVKNYYQEVAWGSLSGILDHVVLWWSPEALATRHSHGAQQLKDWLSQFIQRNHVPQTVRPALQNLCDALGYHATITEWDHLFRLAYTSAFKYQSKSSSTEGTDTGQMFVELFQLLVTLSNECEAGGEWVIGAPLVELPLSEQIVALHRLDHSIHTARLWIVQEAKIIAHTWELHVFFLLVKGDIVNCLEELSYLKLADHTNALSTDTVSVQVYVCAKMRAKIVSEVNVNMELLQNCSKQCIDILAKICRVISLANLHMCFPRSSYWRKGSDVAPTTASLYVEPYFEKVLLPVLEVIEDHETSNMILRIMCEAWLDYIYLHRIKFSEHGALQLLTDFAYVSKWVTSCSIISQNVRDHLLKNEVLRRCEGVGRLLLRHPGEAISMRKRLTKRTNERGSPESPGLERMPAEMYVPNQEQWLELRASKRYNFCCTD